MFPQQKRALKKKRGINSPGHNHFWILDDVTNMDGQVSLLYVTIHLILIMLQNTPNHALLPQQKQGIEKKILIKVNLRV